MTLIENSYNVVLKVYAFTDAALNMIRTLYVVQFLSTIGELGSFSYNAHNFQYISNCTK